MRERERNRHEGRGKGRMDGGRERKTLKRSVYARAFLRACASVRVSLCALSLGGMKGTFQPTGTFSSQNVDAACAAGGTGNGLVEIMS